MVRNRSLELAASGRSGAPRAILWALIEDAAQYQQWGPWTKSGYDRPGTDSPHGTGAIRRFRWGRTTTVERVLDVEPGHRLSY